MNQTALSILPVNESYIDYEEITSTSKTFIQANTEHFTLNLIRKDHTIPCFARDNEPLISHTDFIDLTFDITSSIFQRETILSPNIRVSHPIKGRIPEAKEKAAKELLEHEKTLYYERMAFVIEVPTIKDVINGNLLSLTVGGVKAYSQDNLYNKKGAEEHFKVFIGFQNQVCSNLCVHTDGLKADIKVRTIDELKNAIYSLFKSYNVLNHLSSLNDLTNYYLTEKQFVQVIGRCKLYNYLPAYIKQEIPALQFGDNQLSTICRDYYKDDSFCREADGSINLWKVYNLFTNANKSSYIDTFLDRSLNAFEFTKGIQSAIQHKSESWFLE